MSDHVNNEVTQEGTKEVTIEELFAEVKQELDFLPEDDAVREGFLQVLRLLMIM